MRKIITLLLAALFCCQTLPAADLVPIVDSQTIAIARVDLKQVDTEKIIGFLSGEVRDIVPQVMPNPAEAGQMILMAQGGVMAGAMYVQPILKTLQNEGKVDEIFFLVDKKAIAEEMYPLFVAVPAPASKPKVEIDAIRKLFLQNHLQVVFQRHGFLIGVPVLEDFGLADKDDIMSFVKERFGEPSTEKRPEFGEAFGRPAVSSSMIQVVVGNLSMFKEFFENQPDVPEEILAPMPPQVREMMELGPVSQKLMLEKTNYLFTSLDIQKPELKIVSVMKDLAAAKETIELSEKVSRLWFAMLEGFKERDGLGMPGPADLRIISVLSTMMGKQKLEMVGTEVHNSIDANAYADLKKAIIDMTKSAVGAAHDADNVKITGRISFADGTPLTVGVVAFETETFLARAELDESGNYAMMGEIPEGMYRVSIAGVQDSIDPKFTHPYTSGLVINVKGPRMTFDIVVDR